MNTTTPQSALVSVEWLARNLDDSRVVILDASVPPIAPLPGAGTSQLGGEEPLVYIPGARRFDYDKEIRDPRSSLPHMMPSPTLFTEKVRELGVSGESHVVVYDDVGVYASPRAWWMFKAMGHQRVSVLDGGLPAWRGAGHEVVESLATPEPGDFMANPQPGLFCDFTRVLRAVNQRDATIVDARSPGRFAGRDREPRPGLRSGHMPGAVNLPFTDVLEGSHVKSEGQLRNIFASVLPEDVRIGDQSTPLVFSCGSGLSACILTLAADLAGYRNLSVYDGSWSEWGRPGKLPVVKSA